MLLAITALIGLHLIPLPPALWHALPGRELAWQAGQVAGIDQPWRPLTLVPYRTWNAFFSMLVPLAVLLLWARCPAEQRGAVLPLLLVIGFLSAVVSILQVATGSLYIYKITNLGSAVGIFANRNHQADFLACLFPALAAFVATANGETARAQRLAFALVFGIALLPLILVTGSRAGLLLSVLGIGASLFVFRLRGERRSKKRSSRFRVRPVYIAVGLAVVLVVVTLLLAKGEAVARLLATGNSQEVRLPGWRVVAGLIGQYLPFGSGVGTFVEVFQIGEPIKLIDSSYFNHAHNELLEVALTVGIPGLLLIALGIFAWARCAVRLWGARNNPDRAVILGMLGALISLILGLGSLVDYPLRTPFLGALFVVASLWMAEGCSNLEGSPRRRESARKG